MPNLLDCVIIGAGPAGLSAALLLGRCRRDVLVLDGGPPRNRAARSSHGFFTRDGATPEELRRIGRAQLDAYDSVQLVEDEATSVARRDDGTFTVVTRRGRAVRTRKLLLATGVRDRVPDAPGFRERWARSVFSCPYCDGWEMRGRRLAAYAPAATGPDFAVGLLSWSDDVILVTPDGHVSTDDRRVLEHHGIAVHESAITALEGEGDALHTLVLASGRRLERDALFVHLGTEQAAPFARELGCDVTPSGSVVSGPGQRSGPPGVWVAGDASEDLQLLAVAAAEGVKAACAINTELRRDQLGQARSRVP